EVGYGHVRLLAGAGAEERREAFARDEEVLVDAARQLDPGRLRAVVAHWRHAVDPEGALDDANACHARRRLHASVTYEGMVALDGELDPEGGATLLTALDAVQPGGPQAGDGRTPAQRRADALVELARRALDTGEFPDHGGERPHLTVRVDLATLRRQPASPAGELEPTGPVCAETARRLACDAGVSRVVTAGDSQPLDVGRRTRVVPPAMRRALVWRDRGCRFSGCDRPPAWSDAHHLVHWADGGATSLDNLVLLCRRHHRAIHETGHRLRGVPVRPP
ncbi:MAG: HNH endonuclease, partial [Actinobacteria bacterium]|nr:HNH endonuclease [Actinomycetota bacterium]